MPRTSPARPIIDTAHILALAFWLAALLGSGAAAATLFPKLKALDPTLPAYAAYPHEHWKIAAGFVANHLFFLADIVQFAAAFTATTTFALTLFFLNRTNTATKQRSWSLAIRGVSLAVALTAAAYLILVLGPDMALSLQNFYTAAQQGDIDAANTFRQAFDASHPKASTAMSTTAAAVLIALIAGVWNISSRTTTPNPATPQNA